MINNRQNGRRRGRGGGAGAPRPNGGNGGADRGNRIDNRARGNAAQLLEKYKALARDAQMQGDRVSTEYYLQFADHYFRVLSESRSRFEEQQPRPRRDDFAAQNEGEEDYAEDGETNGNAQPREDDQRRYGQDGNGDGQYAENRGDRRPRRDRDDGRNGDGFAAAPREEDRGDEGRERRPRRDRDEGDYAPVRAEQDDVGEVAPARRGRPRRPAPEGSGEVERIEVDRLPPAFSLTSPPSDIANDAEDQAEKPRRRTRRASGDGAIIDA